MIEGFTRYYFLNRRNSRPASKSVVPRNGQNLPTLEHRRKYACDAFLPCRSSKAGLSAHNIRPPSSGVFAVPSTARRRVSLWQGPASDSRYLRHNASRLYCWAIHGVPVKSVPTRESMRQGTWLFPLSASLRQRHVRSRGTDLLRSMDYRRSSIWGEAGRAVPRNAPG